MSDPSLDPAGPNAAQVTYWSDNTGPKWVELEDRLDAQIGPLGELAIERAGIAEGERVLDVGCGCGQTLLQLGARVGATGEVLGLDVSEPMLARAEARVREAGLSQVSVRRADAQTAHFEAGHFDHLFSRFGVMFFTDPVAAFANLRRALRPGGRVTFICWQPMAQNPWMAIPAQAIAAHVALPPPPEPGAPGPFAFADRERVHGLLAEAGWQEIAHESVERELRLGGSGLDGAVSLGMQMGPAALAMRLAEERGETVDREAVRNAMTEALVPHVRDGDVWLASATWIVEARA